MFDSRVLGVDPGVARTGLAAVSRSGGKVNLDAASTVRTSVGSDDGRRLDEIARAVERAIAESRPSAVAIERVAWNKNQVSALQVARATGVILLIASRAGVPVYEYSPTEVKSAVTGQGNADKEQVRKALVRVHGLQGVPREPDAADAVAVALTHLSASGMLRLAAKAGAR